MSPLGRECVLEPADEMVVERVRDRETYDDRAELDEQPDAQLVEVLDERRLLAVAQAPR